MVNWWDSLLPEGYIHTGVMNRVFSDEWKNQKGDNIHPISNSFANLAVFFMGTENSLKISLTGSLYYLGEFKKMIDKYFQDKDASANNSQSNGAKNEPDIQEIINHAAKKNIGFGYFALTNGSAKIPSIETKKPDLKSIKEKLDNFFTEEILNYTNKAEKVIRSNISDNSTKFLDWIDSTAGNVFGDSFLVFYDTTGKYENVQPSKLFDLGNKMQNTIKGIDIASTIKFLSEKGIVKANLHPTIKKLSEVQNFDYNDYTTKLENGVKSLYSMYRSLELCGAIDENSEITKSQDGSITKITLKDGEVLAGDDIEKLKISFLKEQFNIFRNSIDHEIIEKSLTGLQTLFYDELKFEGVKYNGIDSFQDLVLTLAGGTYSLANKEKRIFGNNIPDINEIRQIPKIPEIQCTTAAFNEDVKTLSGQFRKAIKIVFEYNSSDAKKKALEFIDFIDFIDSGFREFGKADAKVIDDDKTVIEYGDKKSIKFDYRTINKAFKDLVDQANNPNIPEYLKEDVKKIFRKIESKLCSTYENSYALFVVNSNYENLIDLDSKYVEYSQDKHGELKSFTFILDEDRLAKTHLINKNNRTELEKELNMVTGQIINMLKACPYCENLEITANKNRITIKNPPREFLDMYQDNAVEQNLEHYFDRFSKVVGGAKIQQFKAVEGSDGALMNFRVSATSLISQLKKAEVSPIIEEIKELIKQHSGATCDFRQNQHLDFKNIPVEIFNCLREKLQGNVVAV